MVAERLGFVFLSISYIIISLFKQNKEKQCV